MKKLLRSKYFEHRLGFVIAVGELAFVGTFFLENRAILETAMGTAVFFWVWSILLLPLPLIAGSPLKSSLKFFSFFFPLFLLYGLIALVISNQLFFRTISILTIIWVATLTLLMKRKPRTFNLRVNINPKMFLESLILLGLSAFVSFVILFTLELTDILFVFFSSSAIYLILMSILYAIFSMVATSLHFFTNQKGSE
jgi:hypothetical protein